MRHGGEAWQGVTTKQARGIRNGCVMQDWLWYFQ